MNLVTKILILGISIITIISIILALILDAKVYGAYVAWFDIIAIFLWLGSYFTVVSVMNKKKKIKL